jgi:hypothetical protein
MLKCINNANIPYCLKYFQFAFITEGSIGTLTDVVLGTLQVHAQRCIKEQPSTDLYIRDWRGFQEFPFVEDL